MIEFKKETKKITVKIANEQAEVTLRNVTQLDKDAFTVKLLEVKANMNVKQQEAKVNVDELMKEKYYLLAWTWQDINIEERWKTWAEEERLEFLKSWIESDDKEFMTAVEITEKISGRLLEV